MTAELGWPAFATRRASAARTQVSTPRTHADSRTPHQKQANELKKPDRGFIRGGIKKFENRFVRILGTSGTFFSLHFISGQ